MKAIASKKNQDNHVQHNHYICTLYWEDYPSLDLTSQSKL